MDVTTSASMVLSSAGVVFNLANITVYLLQDWRTNNVTLTLLSLSISDFLVLVTCVIFGFLSIVQNLWPSSTYDYLAIQHHIVAWCLGLFSDISSLTTVLVSLERCLCIILPLHVQSLFSVRRTMTALVTVWMLTGLSYAVLYSTVSLQWTYDFRFNNSRLTAVFARTRRQVETGHNISNTMILPTFCQLAVVINTVVMLIGLKRSSNFHRKVAAVSSQLSSGDGHRMPSTSLSKYKKLAAVVCCISVIFVTCNTPTLLFIYIKYFVSEFSYTGAYRGLYLASINLIFLLYSVNASVNFFVYFFLNRRFRNQLREVVCRPVFSPDRVNQ